MTRLSERPDKSILDSVGNTPLVELTRIPAQASLTSDIYVKLEFTNPSGSLKDRIYKEMLTKAVSDGVLADDMEILEVSTGNGGISCAFVGGVLGFKATVVMPEAMSEERKRMIKAFGGNVITTPGAESDVDLCLKKAEQLMNENPGAYWFPDQFTNPNNPAAHFKTTGPEIWRQVDGSVDCFLASQGTGGALTGCGGFLKHQRRDVRLYAVEPEEAPMLSRGQWGSHRIEGIGDGLIPKNLDLSIIDGIITVSSDNAIEMTRRLAKEEGIFCGISSGCNIAAAMKLTKKHPELENIVTMINDSGNRYLSTEAFGSSKKEVMVPDRVHELDEYSKDQLARYGGRLEIIN